MKPAPISSSLPHVVRRSSRAGRRAFMLIAAIVFVGTLAITLTLLGRHFYMLSLTSKEGELQAKAAQLLSAGQAWCRIHDAELPELDADRVIELPAESLLANGEEGNLTIQRAVGGGGIVLKARVVRGRLTQVLTVPISHDQTGS